MIGIEEMPAKKLTDKEQAFLNELEESVNLVNNYPPGKRATTTFKQMLNAL